MNRVISYTLNFAFSWETFGLINHATCSRSESSNLMAIDRSQVLTDDSCSDVVPLRIIKGLKTHRLKVVYVNLLGLRSRLLPRPYRSTPLDPSDLYKFGKRFDSLTGCQLMVQVTSNQRALVYLIWSADAVCSLVGVVVFVLQITIHLTYVYSEKNIDLSDAA